MAAPDDAPDMHWADPLGKPIAYPLRAHIADVYHGWRDGRKRLPMMSAPSKRSTEAADTIAAEGTISVPSLARGEGPSTEAAPADSGMEGPAAATARPAIDGSAEVPAATPFHVGTPHLMRLRALARDLIGQERLAMLEDVASLQKELARLRALAAALDGEVAVTRRDLEVLHANPPSDEDLKERRTAEADSTRRPDRLVRERRLAEYQRRCDGASRAHLAKAAELAQTTQALQACEGSLARRRAIGCTRAHRIYEHALRRVATYWQQLVRVHPYGPELNASLRPVGPELPRWALDRQGDTD